MVPKHLETLRGKIERGEPVDLNQIAMLQALDILELGNEFVRQAIEREDTENEQIKKELGIA